MATPKELLDELLKDGKTPEDLLGNNGVLKQLTKELMERMLEAEMTDHLGYDKHAPEGRGSGNSRHGTSAKTIQGDHGEVPLEVPRDRTGEFEPPPSRKPSSTWPPSVRPGTNVTRRSIAPGTGTGSS